MAQKYENRENTEETRSSSADCEKLKKFVWKIFICAKSIRREIHFKKHNNQNVQVSSAQKSFCCILVCGFLVIDSSLKRKVCIF